MENPFTPRLRSNIFFLLLLRAARSDLGVAPSWGNSSEGLTRPRFFADLLRIVCPSYKVSNEKTLGQYLSQYLSGSRTTSPTYFPFSEPSFQEGADMRIQSLYSDALADMAQLCERYLDTANSFAMKMLTAGLVDLILADDSVDGDFNTGSRVLPRAELDGETAFNLPTFLLSVWHYIIMNKPDAKEGAETYQHWTKSAGGGNPRRITTSIGAERAKKIAVSTELPETGNPADTAENPDTAEYSETKGISEACSDTTGDVHNSTAGDACSDTAEEVYCAETGGAYAGPDGEPLNFKKEQHHQELIVKDGGRIYNQHAEKIINIEHVDVLNI